MDSYKKGSKASMPDMDWSQVHETMLMLELAAAQIQSAITHSDSSVDMLTQTFMAMGGYLRTQQDMLAELPLQEGAEGVRDGMLNTGEQLQSMVQNSIVAFQFYDRLEQRLSHVCHSIESLSKLVGNRAMIFNPDSWVQLQNEIQSYLSTPEERAMFEAVIHGTPVKEAIERFQMETLENDDDDNIELF